MFTFNQNECSRSTGLRNDAGQQLTLRFLCHGLANLHRYSPGRVLVDFQIAGQLEGRQAFLGIQDQHDSQEPLLQWHVAMMEYRAYCYAERRFAVVAAMPMFTGGCID